MIAATDMFAYKKFFLATFLIGFESVLACGQLPQGEVTAITFTASGFTVPAEMAYSMDTTVRNTIGSISHSRDAAIVVVKNLVVNAVNDVLEEQGRNAFLPDAVTSQILQQLNINIDYDPLECPTATNNRMNVPILAMKGGCFIIDNMVTSLCLMNMMVPQRGGGGNMPGCTLMPMTMQVEPIPAKYRAVKGNLKTSNVIMANWSKQMWQSVLNRVARKLASGRLAKYFSAAIVTVDN